MKIRFKAILLLLLASTVSWSEQGASSAPQHEDRTLQDELVAQVDVFMHAWQKHDAASLTTTMVPEFSYVTSRGVSQKAGVVAALTHVCTLTQYSLSDVQLMRISSDSAVLIYKLHQIASCAGHEDPPVVMNTDTFIRREGKWLFILTTSTPVQ